MKTVSRSTFRVLSFAVLFLIMCLGNDQNPYLEARPGAVVQSRSFPDNARVSVFSAESLTVVVNLKEKVEKFSVNVTDNRLWPRSDSVIEASRFTSEPFTFRFSFSDTGTQTVTLVSYLHDGDTLSHEFTFRVRLPLFQDLVQASAGDTVRLSTPAVGDRVTYVWDFQDGRTIETDEPGAEFILDRPFDSKTGELYITAGGVRSPSFVFDLMPRTPGRPPVRFLTRVYDFPSELMVGRDGLSLDLKVNPQTGFEPFRFDVRFTDRNQVLLHNSADGILRWSPGMADVGTRDLRAVVTDLMENSDTINVQILISEPRVVEVSFEHEHSEGPEASQARIKVVLSESSYDRITVPFSVDWARSAANASDISGIPSELVFDPGETEQFIVVGIVDDGEVEDEETVFIQLSEPEGYAVLGDRSGHTYSISDNDRLNVYYRSGSSRVEESAGEHRVDVILSREFDRPVRVRIEVDPSGTDADGHHYSFPSGLSVTFPEGQTHAALVMGISENGTHEPDRTVALRLVSESPFAQIVGNSVHTVTIADDDPEARSIGFVDNSLFGSESGGSVAVRVRLSHAAHTDISVGYEVASPTTASEGSDFRLPSSRTLTFSAGEVEKSIALEIIDDTEIESSESVVLQLVGLPPGVTASFGQCTYTIDDNDTPDVVQVGFAQGVSEGPESVSAVQVRVHLSSPTGVPVTVSVSSGESSAPSTDYRLSADELIFGPGETEKVLTLEVFNNRIKDGSRNVVLVLNNPSSFARLGADRFTYTIHDNDFDLNVNVFPNNSGQVTFRAGGGEQSSPFDSGTEVVLEVTPAQGYVFDHWSGDLSGNGDPASLHIDSDKTVNAHFTLSPPLVTGQPQDQNVSEGESARFSVEASGRDLTYRWQKNGSDVPDGNEAVLVVERVTMDDDGSVFRCVVTNSSGETVSGDARLQVRRVSPEITVHPRSATVNAGETALFTVSADGRQLEYRWFVDGVRVDGSGNSLSFRADWEDNGAQVFCIVSNSGGADTSDTAVLTVVLEPPLIIGHPRDASASEGENVTFGVTASGPELSYRWQKNGLDIEGADDSVLVIEAAREDDGAGYSCIVSNPAGEARSEAAELEVEEDN